jgi:hypothetical protein
MALKRKRKTQTVTVTADNVKFVSINPDIRGGFIIIETWRNGRIIRVRVEITRYWQIQNLKKALNTLVDNEIKTCGRFENALNITGVSE